MTRFLIVLLSLGVASGCSHFISRAPSDETVAHQPLSEASPSGDFVNQSSVRELADYHFTLAEAYSHEGDGARAIEEYRITLVYDPQAVAVRLRLAIEYLRQGLVSESLREGLVAVELDPQHIEAHMFVASVYSLIRTFKKAEEHYYKVVKINPLNAEPLIYIGALYAEQKKYYEAIELFEKAAKVDSSYAHLAYFSVAKVQLVQKNLVLAQKALEKCLSYRADYEEGVLALGQVFEAIDKPEDAIRLYASYQDKFGPSERVAEFMADYLLKLKRYDEALPQYLILARAQPNNLNAKIKVALIYIERKNLKRATEYLEQVLEKSNDSDKVRFYLAALLEESGRMDEAEEHFSRVSPTSEFYQESVAHAAYLRKTRGDLEGALDVLGGAVEAPNASVQNHLIYVSVLEEQERFSEAVSFLKKSTEKFPSESVILYAYGVSVDQSGNFNEGVRILRELLEIDPENIQALNYLAYSFAEKGENLDEAERFALQAMKLKPNDGFISDTYGWVLFKQGRIAESIKVLEKAHLLEKSESVIAEHLADAYYRYQLPEKARLMYESALRAKTTPNQRQKISNKLVELQTHTALQERQPASVP
ncbi:MAG: hypothetical protein COT74_05210 [Bdellovibrionales bacterium CG10_big_fil_rev_8_21_14_0_10_45_34]|nr:MAG: hypothetical protein COT74_05210 [Bdellovibrionales bacterium CG10_big_fil_rev_8_21_14_0_10_45_34]